MDYTQLKAENESLKAEIDTFHAFYESFNRYDLVISNSYGILAEMYSNTLKAKVKNPTSKIVLEQEERINKLIDAFSEMQGLNNKCQSLSLRFKHINQEVFNLKAELTSIKKAHNEL